MTHEWIGWVLTAYLGGCFVAAFLFQDKLEGRRLLAAIVFWIPILIVEIIFGAVELWQDFPRKLF